MRGLIAIALAMTLAGCTTPAAEPVQLPTKVIFIVENRSVDGPTEELGGRTVTARLAVEGEALDSPFEDTISVPPKTTRTLEVALARGGIVSIEYELHARPIIVGAGARFFTGAMDLATSCSGASEVTVTTWAEVGPDEQFPPTWASGGRVTCGSNLVWQS